MLIEQIDFMFGTKLGQIGHKTTVLCDLKLIQKKYSGVCVCDWARVKQIRPNQSKIYSQEPFEINRLVTPKGGISFLNNISYKCV